MGATTLYIVSVNSITLQIHDKAQQRKYVLRGYLSNFPSDRVKTFENSKKENEVGIG